MERANQQRRPHYKNIGRNYSTEIFQPLSRASRPSLPEVSNLRCPASLRHSRYFSLAIVLLVTGSYPLVYYPGLPSSGEQEETFDMEMPDFMADAGSWAFQGVDTAFFDSLMSGHASDKICRAGDWIIY